MQYLQADTAATVLIGAFVDKGDGVTPEEGITLAAADSAEIMKHDGTTFVDIAGAGGNQCTLTHKEKGMYTLLIPAAVLDTEGRLTVFISDESICLPVWKDFMVISQATWASMFTVKASGYMDVANIDVGLKAEGDDALTRIQAIIDDLANATDGLGALAANQTILIKILTGKWEITGNQLIIYDDDDETALYTFDLKNAAGAAASTRVFSRTPA